MKTTKAKAAHDLICNMLRGRHIRQIPGADLPVYIQKAGIALHNLPFAISGEQPLTISHLIAINDLDPDSNDGEWGTWASSLAAAFDVPLNKGQPSDGSF